MLAANVHSRPATSKYMNVQPQELGIEKRADRGARSKKERIGALVRNQYESLTSLKPAIAKTAAYLYSNISEMCLCTNCR